MQFFEKFYFLWDYGENKGYYREAIFGVPRGGGEASKNLKEIYRTCSSKIAKFIHVSKL